MCNTDSYDYKKKQPRTSQRKLDVEDTWALRKPYKNQSTQALRNLERSKPDFLSYARDSALRRTFVLDIVAVDNVVVIVIVSTFVHISVEKKEKKRKKKKERKGKKI